MSGMEPRKREIAHYVSAGHDLFGEWVTGLADLRGRAAIYKRLDRVEEGNFGDYRPVGGGVFELRIHYGPGYRIYYGEDGPRIVLLLCAGEKRTQDKNIRKAQELWMEYRRRK